MRSVLACVVALGALSVSACGTDTGDPADGPTGRWSQQRLPTQPGADARPGFASEGDDILVTVLSEDATLTSYLSRDGGQFKAGEPIAVEGGGYPGFADPVRMNGTWWLVGSGGMVGEGNDEELVFEPRVLRSDDGLAWTPVAVSGIPSPVDVNAVVAADGALVAVGDKRNGVDTGGASFEAAAWRSQDGASWTEVTLPGVVPRPDYADESVAVEAVSAGDRLLAGGGLGRHAALWASDDAGLTWSRQDIPELDELFQISGLAEGDGTVLVTGGIRTEQECSVCARMLRSDDAGRTFRPVRDQSALGQGEEGGYAPVWAGGGRFFTFTEPSYDAYSDAAVCYADLGACGGAEVSDVGIIHVSDAGGSAWSIVDTDTLDVGDEFIGAVGTDDGRAAFAHVVGRGISVSTWSSGPLPKGRPLDEPERVDLVQVPEGEDPEVGVRYHAPLYVHCGMEWLYLGDTPWQRTDGGPDVETGAGDGSPDGWPLAGQTIYGYATLTDEGVVEYSIGGDTDEIIATYEKTGAQPPGCE